MSKKHVPGCSAGFYREGCCACMCDVIIDSTEVVPNDPKDAEPARLLTLLLRKSLRREYGLDLN